MFLRYSLLLFTLLGWCSLVAQAQEPASKGTHAPPIEAPPGRTLQLAPGLRLGPDSVKFKAAFEKLWPSLVPATSVRMRVERRLQRMSKAFIARGVDSVAARQAVMAAFDTTIDRRIMMATFVRAGFTADDLASLATFFKTATGMKYLANDSKIHDARNSYLDQYADRLMASVLDPLLKPKEMHIQKPLTDTVTSEHK